MKKILVVIVLMILAAGGGYYAGTRYPAGSLFKINTSENQESSQGNVGPLLGELGTLMRNPNTTTDDINDFLVHKYGPCWGIPEGECRE